MSYTLDPVGNRLSDTSSLAGVSSGSFSYNPDDELLSETYDANGNVTAANGNAYQYDSQNELVGMNGGAVRLVYDGDGNRVAKTVNGVTTRYLVDDLNPTGYAQVVEETGSVERTYTYGLQRISENQIVNNTWTPSFYEYDGMGSVRQLTNSAGAVTDTYEYDAFGNLLNKTGTTPNEMLYRGEQWDSDLGLYYLRARWYNPQLGRFMSRDPNHGLTTDPKTLHKYLYGDGDPVNGIDPSGRDDLLDVGIIDNRIAANPAVDEAIRGTGLAIACLYLWEGTKFFSNTMNGILYGGAGTVTQISPCAWALVGSESSAPPMVSPFPVPGTPASPWPPRCKDLGDTVQAAKDLANSLGACQRGMSPYELQSRYDSWVALGQARAQYDKVCWNGGNLGHQQQEAQVWQVVGDCSKLLAGSQ